MRPVAAAARVSNSSVAEAALKRLFAGGNEKEIVNRQFALNDREDHEAPPSR
jgi:hypothetical protein